MDIDIRPVGACGALAVLGSQISETTGARVAALHQAVLRAHIVGITEAVPAFASLLVRYDAQRTDYDAVSAAAPACTARLPTARVRQRPSRRSPRRSMSWRAPGSSCSISC